MRLVWPFIFRVATKSPKIYAYANHPEKAPLDVRYNLCREAALSLYKPFRIKYIIKGEENLPEGRVLFCPNHQSDWDCVSMLMVNKKPAGLLAKLDVSRMPVIDGVLRSVSGDYINRGFPLSELRTINSIGKKLVANPDMSYFIWPEGTRTPDVVHHTLSEFHSGAFRVAQTSKAPIVPIALFGTYTLLDFKSKDKKVYPIQISYLKPIFYDEYKDLKPLQIAQLVQSRVDEEVSRQREEQPKLEEYWNRPENVKIYKKESKAWYKAYLKERKAQKKEEKPRIKEWRKTHPLQPKNSKPKLTKEQKTKIKEMREERNQLVEKFKEQGRLEEEKKRKQESSSK